MSKIVTPLNFKKWIDDNRHLLQPPVCNQVVWEDGDYIVMVVGGPNLRKDYHYNETPEFFYQTEGDMVLKIKDGDQFKDVNICEGDIYLLPPKVPHSPQRLKDTVGLVIESKRPSGMLDALEWYCEKCGHQLYRETFPLGNIVTQMPEIFDRFYNDLGSRTCEKCSSIMERP